MPDLIKQAKTTKAPASLKAPDLREDTEKSVQINLSVPRSTFIRLTKMRKAKGSQYEQELIRIFIAEGLDRGGF